MSVTWCNGEFVEQLALDPAERGLMLGDGIFETIAVRGGKAIWLKPHLARMAEAARVFGIPFTEIEVQNGIMAVLAKSDQPSEVLRITLTRGPTGRGLAINGDKPTQIVSLNSFDRGKLPESVRLATASVERHVGSPTSRFKTVSYMDAIAAAREVADRADDALMLNSKGRVASSTVANIFLLQGEALITPAGGEAILPGIARATLNGGARELGLELQLRPVEYAELHSADAVFLTNSLRLATRVSSIDGKACGTRDISFINAFFERNLS